MIVKVFQETEESFPNPGQGWMTMRRLPNGPGRFPYSVAYFRLNWADLEPTEGEYRWQLIDEPLAAWDKHDARIAFRIMATNAHSRGYYYSPKWLFDAGCKSYDYVEGRTDTTSWLPGDHSADTILPVPENLPSGQYTLGIALVDPSSEKPAIQLAIAAPQSNRLYRVGSTSLK